jgi:ketosteroid isomerase-like protein
MTTNPDDVSSLPAVVRRYLEAAWAKDHATAAACFTDDAVVVDDGRTYDGIDAIRGWFVGQKSEWEYTSEATGSRRLSSGGYEVDVHVVGNFPGGVVDLTYTFEVTGELVRHLQIAV